jgi:hypothetical protein
VKITGRYTRSGQDSGPAADGTREGRGYSERYFGTVGRRSRILAFGSAAALIVAGVICAVLVGGLTGQVLTIALISLGLGGVVLLVFLEVGLSEERELARDEERRRRALRRTDAERQLRQRRWPRRPG